MPKKREIKVYGFGELSKQARRRAVDDWRNKGWDFDSHDADSLTGFFKERLEEKGLPSGDVRRRCEILPRGAGEPPVVG